MQITGADHTPIDLGIRAAAGGQVESSAGGYRLSIPAGEGRAYRWAQLDDYMGLPRRKFLRRAPLSASLRARVSAPNLPGTWGFGLWNDPFTASLTIRGASARLPTLPDAAWFFHGSTENYLSLRDDLPASGFTAVVFASARISPALLLPALPFAPLALIRPLARIARRLARLLVRQDTAALGVDVTAWHDYRLDWQPERVRFYVDEALVLETRRVPPPPLGLVIWIDNQYAAFQPSGKLSMGTSESPAPAWLEVESIQIDEE
jgi:hypothetical protein